MPEGQPLPIYREVIANLQTALRQRVLQAPAIELLSNRNNKLVEVVTDVNNTRFVRRSYSRRAIQEIEARGLSFGKAWDEMHRIYDDAGIAMVPSVLFYPTPYESPFPVVVASEYFEGDDLVASPNVDLKVKLATSLGTILQRTDRFCPGFETFSRDMFKVGRDKTGAERLLLIDVDPYLVDQKNLFRRDIKASRDVWCAGYITIVSQLLAHDWCQPIERGTVISAFVRSLRPIIEEFADIERSRTFEALMVAHGMTMGVDLQF